MADVEICRAWGTLRGCRFAADCKYKHEGEQGGTARTRVVTKSGDELCKGWASDRGCRYGDKCPYKHVGAGKVFVEKSAVEKSKEACNNWKSPKGCKAGADCLYKHEGPTGRVERAYTSAPMDRPRAPMRQAPAAGAHAPRAYDPNAPQEECNNWKSEKGCWKGTECHYKHVGRTGNPNPVRPEPRAPRREGAYGAAPAATGAPRQCRFFNTAEGCKQGKDCKFSHH